MAPEVPASDIVKGYQVSPDRYVIISENDLKAISPKASRIIEISDFVKLDEIDNRYYDSSYYPVPDQGAGKAYALLLQGMTEANVVGIAKFVLRNKEYLTAIRPTDQVITFHIRYVIYSCHRLRTKVYLSSLLNWAHHFHIFYALTVICIN